MNSKVQSAWSMEQRVGIRAGQALLLSKASLWEEEGDYEIRIGGKVMFEEYVTIIKLKIDVVM